MFVSQLLFRNGLSVLFISQYPPDSEVSKENVTLIYVNNTVDRKSILLIPFVKSYLKFFLYIRTTSMYSNDESSICDLYEQPDYFMKLHL